MADSFSKKEREKKKKQRKKEKAAKKVERKSQESTGDDFMYLDEDGNLTSTPPDPTQKRKTTKLEDIQIGPPKQEKSDKASYVREGMLKYFNTEKGYGFIEDSASHEDYFVHIDSFQGDIRERDKVSFEIGKGPKGPIALSVKLISKD